VNNGIYGMTGGQWRPPRWSAEEHNFAWGRRPANEGFPLHMAELLATLEAPAYIERVALSDNKNIMKARRAIRKPLSYNAITQAFRLSRSCHRVLPSGAKIQWRPGAGFSIRWYPPSR